MAVESSGRCHTQGHRHGGITDRGDEWFRSCRPWFLVPPGEFTEQEHGVDPYGQRSRVVPCEGRHELHGGRERRLSHQGFTDATPDPIDRVAIGWKGELRKGDIRQESSTGGVERALPQFVSIVLGPLVRFKDPPILRHVGGGREPQARPDDEHAHNGDQSGQEIPSVGTDRVIHGDT